MSYQRYSDDMPYPPGHELDSVSTPIPFDHTDECQLTCEHCHHGSACYKACCWCGAVRDGEGEPVVECTCKAVIP